MKLNKYVQLLTHLKNSFILFKMNESMNVSLHWVFWIYSITQFTGVCTAVLKTICQIYREHRLMFVTAETTFLSLPAVILTSKCSSG